MLIINRPPHDRGWLSMNDNGRRSSPRAHRVRHILFLSTTAVARSWMAATVLADCGGPWIHAAFGCLDAAEIPAAVRESIRELDLRALFEEAVPASELHAAPELVVVLGTQLVLAPSPATEGRTWNVADPQDEPLETVRTIRDGLVERVRALARELSVDIEKSL